MLLLNDKLKHILMNVKALLSLRRVQKNEITTILAQKLYDIL